MTIANMTTPNLITDLPCPGSMGNYHGGSSLLYPANMQSDLLSERLPKNEKIRLELPRFGTAKDSCGKWISYGKACKEKEHFEKTFQPIMASCLNPDCPVCADKWAWREGDTSTVRLMGCRHAYIKTGFQGIGQFDHVTFSIPDGVDYCVDTLEDYLKRRKEFYQILRRVGMWAGVSIYHHWRFKHGDGSSCEDKKKCGKKHYRQVSPHWHVVGIGYLQKSNEFYKDTGWIYKKIQKGMGNEKIKRVIHYLLTHCTLIIGGESNKRRCHALTWFGEFNNAKIKVQHHKTMNVETCEICEKPLYEVWIKKGHDIDGVSFQDIDSWGGEISYYQRVKSYGLRGSPMRQTKILDDYRGMTDRG